MRRPALALALLAACTVPDKVGSSDDDGAPPDAGVEPTPDAMPDPADTTAPDTFITAAPPLADNSEMVQFEFTSDDAAATFTCSLDSGPYVACRSGDTFGPIDDGAHGFAVRAEDAAGNVDATPAMHAWSTDTSTPDTQLLSGPMGAVQDTSATFTFVSPDAGPGASFQCSLDGSAFATCTSPKTYASLSEDSHTFRVRVRDSVGNVDPSPATRTWTVDRSAPVVTITSGPAEDATVGPYVTIEFTASDGAVVCSLDGQTFAACTSPLSWSLREGNHDVRIRATDAAGNSVTVTRRWVVACAAPPAGADSVGLFHFEEDDQTVINAAGEPHAVWGNDLTVEPADPSRGGGRFDHGVAFQASESDRITWPAAAGALDAFTVELWSRPAGAGAAPLVATSDDRFVVTVTTGGGDAVYRAEYRGDDGATVTATSGNALDDRWHHVIASFDRPTLRLWVDGVLQGEPSDPDATGAISFDGVVLGASYEGELDELHVTRAATTGDDAARPLYCPP